MTNSQPQPIELRDKAGKLYAKLVAPAVIEIRRDGKTVKFDLITGKPIDTKEHTR